MKVKTKINTVQKLQIWNMSPQMHKILVTTCSLKQAINISDNNKSSILMSNLIKVMTVIEQLTSNKRRRRRGNTKNKRKTKDIKTNIKRNTKDIRRIKTLSIFNQLNNKRGNQIMINLQKRPERKRKSRNIKRSITKSKNKETDHCRQSKSGIFHSKETTTKSKSQHKDQKANLYSHL